MPTPSKPVSKITQTRKFLEANGWEKLVRSNLSPKRAGWYHTTFGHAKDTTEAIRKTPRPNT